jgi:uroporphyrinogen-III decarboxylase
MYDRLVIPYEKRIVQKFKNEYGLLCNAHCHGRVKHALNGMLEIGFDSTDPVEIPPDGDVTIAEARAIVGDRMTLIGNIEFYELEFRTPEQIRERVREILAAGPRRLIVGTSGGPLTDLSPQLEANYFALIDETLKHA